MFERQSATSAKISLVVPLHLQMLVRWSAHGEEVCMELQSKQGQRFACNPERLCHETTMNSNPEEVFAHPKNKKQASDQAGDLWQISGNPSTAVMVGKTSLTLHEDFGPEQVARAYLFREWDIRVSPSHCHPACYDGCICLQHDPAGTKKEVIRTRWALL
jgi:hypothetical protein